MQRPAAHKSPRLAKVAQKIQDPLNDAEGSRSRQGSGRLKHQGALTMALLRQCLQSLRAMRGDDLPPPLSQCTTERRTYAAMKSALTDAHLPSGRDPRQRGRSATSPRGRAQ